MLVLRRAEDHLQLIQIELLLDRFKGREKPTARATQIMT